MGIKKQASKNRAAANAVRQLINENKDPLVTLYFATWRDPETKTKLRYLGQIVAKITATQYLVRYYDGLDMILLGQIIEWRQEIVDVSTIATWTLYEDRDGMILAVEEWRRIKDIEVEDYAADTLNIGTDTEVEAALDEMERAK